MEREPPASRWLRNCRWQFWRFMGQGALSQMAQMDSVSASVVLPEELADRRI